MLLLDGAPEGNVLCIIGKASGYRRDLHVRKKYDFFSLEFSIIIIYNIVDELNTSGYYLTFTLSHVIPTCI